MPASTSTTSEFSPAIDRIRQRIGTERARSTTPTRLRAARLARRSVVSSCSDVSKADSLHLTNAFDQFGSCGIALGFCVDAGHRVFEGLAVEIGHDSHASCFRLLAR